MTILKKAFNKDFLKILGLFLALMLFQNCSTYKKSTNLEEASRAEQEGIVKVTMANGDQYIYESIELKENTYYGVKTINGEKTKTVLLKEDVMKVERQNKKSSGFLGIAGITIGIASIILAVLMF